MTIFGITGGSGSGKTTASAILSSLGAEVIDTDEIAHEIVEPEGECIKELIGYFGNEILQNDGTLNRKKLASIAFSDENNRLALNDITHRFIKACVLERIQNSEADMIVIDGAVIIGSSIEPICEFIVSVVADRSIQCERIKTRDALTDIQIKQRLDAQPDEEFYKAHSRYIIYNNGTADELREKVCRLYNEIKR